MPVCTSPSTFTLHQDVCLAFVHAQTLTCTCQHRRDCREWGWRCKRIRCSACTAASQCNLSCMQGGLLCCSNRSIKTQRNHLCRPQTTCDLCLTTQHRRLRRLLRIAAARRSQGIPHRAAQRQLARQQSHSTTMVGLCHSAAARQEKWWAAIRMCAAALASRSCVPLLYDLRVQFSSAATLPHPVTIKRPHMMPMCCCVQDSKGGVAALEGRPWATQYNARGAHHTTRPHHPRITEPGAEDRPGAWWDRLQNVSAADAGRAATAGSQCGGAKHGSAHSVMAPAPWNGGTEAKYDEFANRNGCHGCVANEMRYMPRSQWQ